MPVALSSLTGPAIGQLLTAAQALGAGRARLLPVLAAVPGPQARRGVGHQLAVILSLALCAVLAGARSFTAIAEWAADADQASGRGHGRTERRTLTITAVAAGLAFPHAAQAIQIVRRRRPLHGENSKKWSTETVYAITSLTAIQARPADLAAIIRGHWLIEDRLHWVRDMGWDEDRSRVCAGNGPRVMASLPVD